jgi:acetyl esterase/lipase
MAVDRRTALLGSLAVAGLAGSARAAAAPPGDPAEEIELWPGGPPGAPSSLPAERVEERSADPAIRDRALLNVSRPRLAVFRPKRPNGQAALIMPGGGYRWVVIDKEGYELGRWLADRGLTVFVLFYRLPGQGWAAGPDTALSDAQRAIRLVRSRASAYGIGPGRIAAIGFSAGGHLCADLATRFAHPAYAPVDAADRLSARPDLAAPIYPVISMSPPAAHPGSRQNLVGADAGLARERAYSPHLNVTPETPPCFLLHAEDDTVVPVENTLLFREALKARGVPVDTHLYAKGGHGFGLRLARGKPVEAWPDALLAWLSRSFGS